ncbi:hypothetical protein [Actinospica robiniae]|uniref:hypothetical protein n=1 Tax=Actinospica robiniae TaxID=304901 RepID=UPI00040100DF|nr:hypothetical protein [Actinospica robiniae]
MLHETRLTAEAEFFHDLSQRRWRAEGRTETTLIYLPEHGEAAVEVLFDGTPMAPERLASRARAVRAAALIVTGEAWVGGVVTEAAARLPAQDRPHPAEMPGAYEAIITTAVRADGLSVFRLTRIIDGAFGRLLAPQTHTDPGQNCDGMSAWMHAILTAANHPA